MGRFSRTQITALAVPCALYLLGVVLLGSWIVDDAGISFAYARNVAHLEGFVSQPGRVPVEGFSDPLWVILLVPTFWLHLFDHVITAKVLGALCTCGAFAVLQRLLVRRTGSIWPGVVVTTLLALSPPVVIWSASGLENGLVLLLVVAFFAVLAERAHHWQRWAGVLAVLLAATRPEGLLFIGGGALACFADNDGIAKPRNWRAIRRSLAAFAGTVALLGGPLFALRLALFHLPLPHTYYAKRAFLSNGERLRFFVDHPGELTGKLADFAHGLAGPLGLPLLVATVVALGVLARRRQLRRELRVAAVLQLVAVSAFVWIDEDWMGEYRFATAAIATSLLTAVLAAYALIPVRARQVTLGWAVFGAIALAGFAPRLARFAAKPTVPLADIERHAQRINSYADALHLEHGSILAEDLGGELLDSHLTVYDAAGLCEPDVVRTIKQGTTTWVYAHPEFYTWVFETIRPTFVSTNGFWTNVTGLDFDPRFARDYVAIDAYADDYVQQTYGRAVRSGDYVRRDALRAPGDLERLRHLERAPARPDPLAVRIGEALGLLDTAAVPSPDDRILDPNRAITLLQRQLDRGVSDKLPVLLALGQTLDRIGRYDEARTAYLSLSLVAAEAGDTAMIDAAEGRLQRADAIAATAPGQVHLMESALDLLYRRGDAPGALVPLHALLALNPNHYGATNQLAIALDRAGQRAAATPLWRRVLALALAYNDATNADAARARLATP